MDNTVGTTMISIDMLRNEFVCRGYSYEEMVLSGRRFSRFTGSDGWMWLTPHDTVSYPFVTHAASRISALKHLTYECARQSGLIVPVTLEGLGSSSQQIDDFLQRYAPLVVKPVHDHGSKGVTLDVVTSEALEAAVAVAQVGGEGVLLQQQFRGSEVRVTVFKGRVVSAILRQTPRVVGDGVSTVEQLIDAENKERALLIFDCLSYPPLDEAVAGASMVHSQDVPSKDEVIELSKSTMVSHGASLYNITDTLHQSYKEAALQFAQSINPDFLAIDIMVQDHTQPLTDTNYVFIESNTSPSLKLYYAVRDGKTYDIVGNLVDAIISQRACLLGDSTKIR